MSFLSDPNPLLQWQSLQSLHLHVVSLSYLERKFSNYYELPSWPLPSASFLSLSPSLAVSVPISVPVAVVLHSCYSLSHLTSSIRETNYRLPRSHNSPVANQAAHAATSAATVPSPTAGQAQDQALLAQSEPRPGNNQFVWSLSSSVAKRTWLTIIAGQQSACIPNNRRGG